MNVGTCTQAWLRGVADTTTGAGTTVLLADKVAVLVNGSDGTSSGTSHHQ